MQPDDLDDDTIIVSRTRAPSDPGLPDEDTIVRGTVLPDESTIVRPRAAGSAAVTSSVPLEDFHRFRVNNHEPIGLDAPAVIGRRPVAPRVSNGRPPRLVRVPSPLHEVSAVHVELRQQGTTVVVTDLRSTNGTLVTIPGAVPLKLRQGESVVVSTGTVVDIGDGTVIEILPGLSRRPPVLP
ncbi:MAG TPA: FHA domain-containing protein [Lacisediminihabitans sp.]|uniref:FHA domain-containing protein n=1 Tax=Lacisediminihabitans sp. TaxID=2787631 RepID=UPI002ED9219B